MRDYIAEANKFMYDDNYIVETKVKVDGKVFASKQAAEANLEAKGLTYQQIEDKLKHALKIATDDMNTKRDIWKKAKNDDEKKQALKHLNDSRNKKDDADIALYKHQKSAPAKISDSNLKKHLKNSKEIHNIHSTDLKDEHWAREKHDYDAAAHKKAIDAAEAAYKKGKLTKGHIDSLKHHAEKGQKAYNSATKVWDEYEDED